MQAIEIDYIDESEVLSPADDRYHIDKTRFDVPFVCGARDLGEALRRIAEGASMIRTKGEPGTGDVVQAVRHMRHDAGRDPPRRLDGARTSCSRRPSSCEVPYELVLYVHEHRKLPVVNFAAGGVATPGGRGADDAARRGGRVRRLGHLQIRQPRRSAPPAIVKAVTNYNDAHMLGRAVGGSR